MTSTNSEKEEIIEEVKQQLAAANAQELLTKMTEKCFCKCITRPGAQLNSSEQKCISMCMDRFIDSWNLVSRAYGTRIQREQNRINAHDYRGALRYEFLPPAEVVSNEQHLNITRRLREVFCLPTNTLNEKSLNSLLVMR
ncbi:mitochondrial import inner membrane translocase subunit Tim13-like [Glossina fuscipes]|uniref:Mitochondrial import inner membrane translocase subunit n=1 Tax=Glossina fuscipes TaxID=7396 RepID=A0A8U0WKL8_9MUSC|nr:mitochondrial import inner membrane translocase subunit Tim13-like [Glossina fuscipes]